MFFEEKDGRVLVRVRILPNASGLKAGGLFTAADGTVYLKVSVVSVPEKGKANKELIAFLAKRLNTAKSDIIIISGETDRYKKLEISGDVGLIVSRLRELAE